MFFIVFPVYEDNGLKWPQMGPGNSFGAFGPSIGLCLGISDSPERLTTLPQALCSLSDKWPPYFWKPLTCGYVAAGFFLSRKMAPIFLEAPNLGAGGLIYFFWGGASRVHQVAHDKPMEKA